jgi:hypothetical protein
VATTKVNIAELSKIPFLNHTQMGGRFLCSTVFFDGEWRAWIDAGEQLIATRMWPAESVYFGKSAEKETDFRFHFLDLMGQRLNYLPITRQMFGLQDDVFNLSASLAKIRLLHRTRNDHKSGASRMVATEVEYLYGVCRSVFDLLQEVIAILWGSIKLRDDTVKKQQLKSKSYGDIILHDGKLRTVEELSKRFPGFPPPLIDCYVRSGVFFSELRDFRNKIAHQGAGVQVVFDGEDDFEISENRLPFSEMNIWQDADRRPNGLVPLMPALGFMIYRTLECCDYFSQTIENIFTLPPLMVPNFYLFLRGYFNEELAVALNDIQARLAAKAQT